MTPPNPSRPSKLSGEAHREQIAKVIRREGKIRRYFSRHAMDKSHYEVIHDLHPRGAITDDSFKVVSKHASSKRAEAEVEKLCALDLADRILALPPAPDGDTK